ncbi:MAG: AsmA-like C-terminal region-containing protein, partial [Rhodomicrobium sp.]|nr:AsmA-like C-terminal region-containing protein [Rhodomicrobium sp.]
MKVAEIKFVAQSHQEGSVLDLSARVDERWDISAKAFAALPDWQPDITLHGLSVRNGETALAQQGAAKLGTANGLRLDGLVLRAGEGRISADVLMAETLGGKIEIEQLPASLAALFTPEIQPRGAIDGSIGLGGSPAAPDLSYRLSWQGGAIPGLLPPAFPDVDIFGIRLSAQRCPDNRCRRNRAGGAETQIGGQRQRPQHRCPACPEGDRPCAARRRGRVPRYA